MGRHKAVELGSQILGCISSNSPESVGQYISSRRHEVNEIILLYILGGTPLMINNKTLVMSINGNISKTYNNYPIEFLRKNMHIENISENYKYNMHLYLTRPELPKSFYGQLFKSSKNPYHITSCTKEKMENAKILMNTLFEYDDRWKWFHDKRFFQRLIVISGITEINEYQVNLFKNFIADYYSNYFWTCGIPLLENITKENAYRFYRPKNEPTTLLFKVTDPNNPLFGVYVPYLTFSGSLGI